MRLYQKVLLAGMALLSLNVAAQTTSAKTLDEIKEAGKIVFRDECGVSTV